MKALHLPQLSAFLSNSELDVLHSEAKNLGAKFGVLSWRIGDTEWKGPGMSSHPFALSPLVHCSFSLPLLISLSLSNRSLVFVSPYFNTLRIGTKSLSEQEKEDLKKRLNLKAGDLLVFLAGPRHKGESVLGKLRTVCKDIMLQKKLLPELPKYFSLSPSSPPPPSHPSIPSFDFFSSHISSARTHVLL